ncbi:MAG: murein biosynthesis integral membrane protein MurJ [Longimicrobiales bacterium]|nr:murein biosynthesis integral membrane protein MurJ [Longimicrobiales bacterium]
MKPESRSGGRAAASVGSGIFLSKIFGFVRERVFAHYFGASPFADAWWAALRMPNVLRNLLGEGTLSASMIPVYAELLEEGRDEAAARFAGAALGILATLAAVLVLAGIALAPVLVELFFPAWDPETRELTVRLVRILFPMTGLFVVSAWALGILNSHRIFFVSFVAPVFWNLAMITAMIGGAVYFGLDRRSLVEALAWGALVGGGLTILVQLPFLARYAEGMRVSLGRGVDGVAEAVRNFVPVVAARGVVNLSGWIDMILAGRLTPGAVAVMGYAQTFANLPISLFGTGVAAAELPELSRMRSEHRALLTDRVSSSLARALYFLIPSAVVYVVLGDVIVGALYQTGAFDVPQTLITWGVLAAYAAGLPASASSRVLSSAFYALRDTRTPAKMAYLRVGISVVVGVSLMFPADRLGFATLRLGAAGLAAGSTAGAWIELALLRRALKARIGRHGPPARKILRLTLAAVLAGLGGVAMQVWLPDAHPVLVALETLIPFGVVYLVATSAMGDGISLRRSSG